MKPAILTTHELTQGDTYVELLTFIDKETKESIDLSGFTAIKQDIRKYTTTKSELIASVNLVEGITLPTINSIQLFIKDTSGWLPGTYYRDIKFTNESTITTWCVGKIKVLEKKTE